MNLLNAVIANKYLRRGFAATESNPPSFKIHISHENKLFALYHLHEDYFTLEDCFHSYNDATQPIKEMIDRTPGMKEKINNYFS